jgi:dTDP-glucose 4,6-dehydratase
MRILVTGGAGFIGSHFARHVLRASGDCQVTVLDKLTYAGNLDNLRDLNADARYRFIAGDVADAEGVQAIIRGGIDAIVHFAAETHVDRSILDAGAFVRTNVLGTQVLLDTALRHGTERYIQVSTDEVYGPAPQGAVFTEDQPLNPSSPYAASKAAADLLCQAFRKTHGLPVVIARCTNNYGPYQFPEKFIPLMITNALEGKPVPIYGDGRQERDWLFVEDHCAALHALLQHHRPEPVVNIASGRTEQNLVLAEMILDLVGAPRSLLEFVTDRPAHDRRYALTAARITATTGWRPRWSLEDGLAHTVEWFRANSRWWQAVKTGEYLRHYAAWYQGALAHPNNSPSLALCDRDTDEKKRSARTSEGRLE